MKRLVVVGHGMVGHKLLEELASRDVGGSWQVDVFAEEPRPAYDRVAMTSYVTGTTEAELSLVEDGFFDRTGYRLHLSDPVVTIDLGARTITSATGRTVAYDALVLATGSVPFVPPIPGADRAGCFVYRTLEDLDAITAWARPSRTGIVIGGGLLGLEAAGALQGLGVETHIVEFAPRLMPVQVDGGGGDALRRRIEALGVVVHADCQTTEVLGRADGAVAGLRFADGDDLPADFVVFSAGIRPCDQLAIDAGLERHERGGIIVDEACRTSDPTVYAIGECAVAAGRVWGLVAPGYAMARVVADRLLGGDAAFAGGDLSTKLKLLGIDVASVGDAHGAGDGTTSIVLADERRAIYKKLVVGPDGHVVGGVLVGDASAYATLLGLVRGDLTAPDDLAALLSPERVAGLPGEMAASALVCSCNSVTKGQICGAITEHELVDVAGVKKVTAAGTGCGGCVPVVTELLQAEQRRTGAVVRNDLCEHFAFTRQELFDIVRIQSFTSFSELIARHGSGHGCEVCKPAVASMLAALANGYILDGEQASLQDTNDHLLANLQRDGTYSVIPRIPGGEVTPEQLITIGEVARDFGLYSKITGGQRIDLLGARAEQLPAIWARLIAAGMESGHAYGKALRTVKSCVGLTWCRYGVQDSTALAITLEQRYRGLRAPHKIKCAVSGCTRECAEAQSKDVGVIATERGWNLYVAGNGGMRPRHAVLLAEGLDTDTLIRITDRFLAYYIRTADRLERTATWFAKLEGGVDHLRRVLIDDALGVASDLEADIARHIERYECEWTATLADPDRLRRFRTFVNTDAVDPNIVLVPERGQVRPATFAEKPDPERSAAVPVVIRR